MITTQKNPRLQDYCHAVYTQISKSVRLSIKFASPFIRLSSHFCTWAIFLQLSSSRYHVKSTPLFLMSSCFFTFTLQGIIMPTLDLFQECIALPLLATYGLRKNHTRLLCLFPEISVCVMFHMLVTILVQYFSSWIVVTVYFICFFSMLPGFHRRNNSFPYCVP